MGDRLLVATGKPYSASKKTEAIGLTAGSSNNNICPEFPVDLDEATSGVLSDKNGNDVAVVCGGRDTADARDLCFYYAPGKGQKEWVQVAKKLAEKRLWAAGIVTDIDGGRMNSLWIAGGNNGRERLSSTELVTLTATDSFEIRPGPDLPLALHSHCLVKLNSTTAMLIGGSDGVTTFANSYFLDIPSAATTTAATAVRSVRGPDLNTARTNHACGVVDNPTVDGGQMVVVAGGWYSGYLSSTEMLSVDGRGFDDRWVTEGLDLPVGIGDSAGVESTDGKSFLLVGGGSSSAIYKLEFNNGEWQWKKMSQEMQVARDDPVAMIVPDAFC